MKRADRSNSELENTITTANQQYTGKLAIAGNTQFWKHAIDFDSGCVIYPENNSAKRKIGEALYIKSEQVFETTSILYSYFKILNLKM